MKKSKDPPRVQLLLRHDGNPGNDRIVTDSGIEVANVVSYSMNRPDGGCAENFLTVTVRILGDFPL